MNVRFVPNSSIRNVWAEDFSFYRWGLGLGAGNRLHGTRNSPDSQPPSRLYPVLFIRFECFIQSKRVHIYLIIYIYLIYLFIPVYHGDGATHPWFIFKTCLKTCLKLVWFSLRRTVPCRSSSILSFFSNFIFILPKSVALWSKSRLRAIS